MQDAGDAVYNQLNDTEAIEELFSIILESSHPPAAAAASRVLGALAAHPMETPLQVSSADSG